MVWPRETVFPNIVNDTSTWGTIWSMCFVSKDFCRHSKQPNPLLAIVVNRYGN